MGTDEIPKHAVAPAYAEDEGEDDDEDHDEANETSEDQEEQEDSTSTSWTEGGSGEEDTEEPPGGGQGVHCFYLVAMLLIAVSTVFIGFVLSRSNPDNFAVASKVLLTALFAVGLLTVALEDFVEINKSAVMLGTAAMMWLVHSMGYHPVSSNRGEHRFNRELNEGLIDVGEVVLFLLPAMAVVESIDHFGGFAIVTHLITKATAGNRGRLIPIVSVCSFFLSSVIDNLTATIVALKILRHVASEDEVWRRFCGSVVVIASNAGGTWSPIGDVTTIMLWIQGKISTQSTIVWLFLPSFIAGIVPSVGLWYMTRKPSFFNGLEEHPSSASQEHLLIPELDEETKQLPGVEEEGENALEEEADMQLVPLQQTITTTPQSMVVFVLGVCVILAVPALKAMVGLPPYLGMLLALGIVWLITDAFNFSGVGTSIVNCRQQPLEVDSHGYNTVFPQDVYNPKSMGVVEALHKVDLTGLLFFAGVLWAVGALDASGVLDSYAELLLQMCGGSPVMLSSLLGVSSAIVDNVPLVQAAIDMFDDVTMDAPMWQLIALAASTGGSMTSIGSIAGVTFMSMEEVSFMWYIKYVSPWASLGFITSIATYQLQRELAG